MVYKFGFSGLHLSTPGTLLIFQDLVVLPPAPSVKAADVPLPTTIPVLLTTSALRVMLLLAVL